MRSIAHIREEDDCIQSVEDHLLGVKKLAENYGNKIGVKHVAGLAGLLHDVGKYSKQFVDYILKAVYQPEEAPKRGSVDHSTAGGKLLYELFHKGDKNNAFKKALAEIVGNAIISHHSYLHDFLTPDLELPYLRRVKKKDIEDFSVTKKLFFKKVISKKEFRNYVKKAVKELEEILQRSNQEELEFFTMFLTKYVFSCLIDADRTNTRLFVENLNDSKQDVYMNTREMFSKYYKRLIEKLETFKNNSNVNKKINILRSNMSEQCEKFAEKRSGIYTLSIPTGGGKTLSSFRYALKHAEKHNKERIIYVVPYTTIIEQNAHEIRGIIDDDINLLEHHSNLIIHLDDNTEEDIYQSNVNKALMLAKDNWDVPIIFTTMVQFLNVFYSNRSRDVRRLHNLSKSVIIFDEVQKVPIHCVSLFNKALNFLQKYAYANIILCTATQPALDYVEHKLHISADAEIVKDLPRVTEKFKRVNLIDKASNKTYSTEKLSYFIFKQIETNDSILIILNTKQVVRKLFQLIADKVGEEVKVFHLSTSMCAAHRNDILERVNSCLDNDQKVICISTQLIEAGVDISFECVIRSLAGLDSIAQAAGRCNRHGEDNRREVYVIDHEEENLDKLNEIRIGKEITKNLLIDLERDSTAHGGSMLSKQAMERYFQEFYREFRYEINYPLKNLNTYMTSLLGNAKEIKKAFINKSGENFPLVLANSYRTAANHFKVIEDNTTPVLVPYGKGEDLIAQFNSFEMIDDFSDALQNAQQYMVNLYEHELHHLKTKNQIVHLLDEKVLALVDNVYDKEYGVDIEGEASLDFTMF